MSGGSPTIYIVINDGNDHPPEFQQKSYNIDLPEDFPLNLDATIVMDSPIESIDGDKPPFNDVKFEFSEDSPDLDLANTYFDICF